MSNPGLTPAAMQQSRQKSLIFNDSWLSTTEQPLIRQSGWGELCKTYEYNLQKREAK